MSAVFDAGIEQLKNPQRHINMLSYQRVKSAEILPVMTPLEIVSTSSAQ